MQLDLSFMQWLGVLSYLFSILVGIVSATVFLSKLVTTVNRLNLTIEKILDKQGTHETRISILEEWKRIKG